jgi:hypothetical protein
MCPASKFHSLTSGVSVNSLKPKMHIFITGGAGFIGSYIAESALSLLPSPSGRADPAPYFGRWPARLFFFEKDFAFGARMV